MARGHSLIEITTTNIPDDLDKILDNEERGRTMRVCVIYSAGDNPHKSRHISKFFSITFTPEDGTGDYFIGK